MCGPSAPASVAHNAAPNRHGPISWYPGPSPPPCPEIWASDGPARLGADVPLRLHRREIVVAPAPTLFNVPFENLLSSALHPRVTCTEHAVHTLLSRDLQKGDAPWNQIVPRAIPIS